ncbi:hypothetical protein ROZALSC1DRAFT_24451 [Rozella allomycis CSF55]|uniref:Uncharacterized protein n=1 Tax=Rozella allomycis (strain CSF55) TaxID=988480 RepID=A0A4P9YDH8_ROZAC|nr:hypothetical protein ROZALSC1DRAFT_24451 [Rozella allomycis CSF55]
MKRFLLLFIFCTAWVNSMPAKVLPVSYYDVLDQPSSIEKILDRIDDLAFQSKILSLRILEAITSLHLRYLGSKDKQVLNNKNLPTVEADIEEVSNKTAQGVNQENNEENTTSNLAHNQNELPSFIDMNSTNQFIIPFVPDSLNGDSDTELLSDSDSDSGIQMEEDIDDENDDNVDDDEDFLDQIIDLSGLELEPVD